MTVARYRDLVQRQTLRQHILFMTVIGSAVATVVDAATSAVTGSFSWWPGVAVWIVLMAAHSTWCRPGSLPQGKGYPAGQSDDSTRF
jgi:hypothetical protein